MPRINRSELRQVVLDAIASAGGEISHNDLVAALENAGNGQAVSQILSLKHGGYIKARLATSPDAPAVLMYSGGNS